ncbi:hypothetical protein [Flavihumibacter fluvii]|uniref:hypothetical protein n=1 Tax=Flavihumibacter fluvii TaxID=2838157 RepID=UPI001BDDD9C2|nr:hypothetical protein [Flavihumibacter fluvii]ULQ54441.1 hypothetical protein KJS93_08935 [Flavihumibacter fluvii]
MIMSYVSIISLVIFIPILIQPSLANMMISNFPFHVVMEKETYGYIQVVHNFLIYNFSSDFFYRTRNVGLFWEAGVFGGFLFVALISNTIMEKSIFNKKGILFIATILSTFSTTAYLTLFLFIGIYYAVKIGSPILRALGIALFAILFTYAYSELEFLGDKISAEIKNIAFDAQLQGGNSRMASAYLDITELTEKNRYLFIGRSEFPEYRVATADKDVQRNNGTTEILAAWGVPFFIIYIILLTRSFKSLCRYYEGKEFVAILFVIIMLTLGFSEPYFRFGFFWGLLLLYVPYEMAIKASKESGISLQTV